MVPHDSAHAGTLHRHPPLPCSVPCLLSVTSHCASPRLSHSLHLDAKPRSQEETVTTLGSHAFFGEMALINPTGKATASVRVITYFEGYKLGIIGYAKLVHDHPSFLEYLQVRLPPRHPHAPSTRSWQLRQLVAPVKTYSCVNGFVGPVDPSTLQAAAKLRLRRREDLKGESKEEDLQTLFAMLDPTKRKLIKLERQAEKEAAAEAANPRTLGTELRAEHVCR